MVGKVDFNSVSIGKLVSGFKMLNKVILRAQTLIAFMSSRIAEADFPLSKTISGAIYGCPVLNIGRLRVNYCTSLK